MKISKKLMSRDIMKVRDTATALILGRKNGSIRRLGYFSDKCLKKREASGVSVQDLATLLPCMQLH